MKKQLVSLTLSLLLMLSITSCGIDDHNEAPNKGKNLDNRRIYGNINGKPKQLGGTNDKQDPAMQVKIDSIRNKFYPK